MINDVIVASAIVAVIEGIKTYIPQVNGGVTIILAGVLGGVAGLAHIAGLDPISGIYLGLAATGVHQVASALGGK